MRTWLPRCQGPEYAAQAASASGPAGSTSARALLRGMWNAPVMTMLARKARQPAITSGVWATTAVTTLRSEVPTMTSTSGARGADRLICCMASRAARVGVRSSACMTKAEKAYMAPPNVAAPSAVAMVRVSVRFMRSSPAESRETIHG